MAEETMYIINVKEVEGIGYYSEPIYDSCPDLQDTKSERRFFKPFSVIVPMDEIHDGKIQFLSEVAELTMSEFTMNYIIIFMVNITLERRTFNVGSCENHQTLPEYK